MNDPVTLIILLVCSSLGVAAYFVTFMISGKIKRIQAELRKHGIWTY